VELLRELTQLQHERGYLDGVTLRDLSARQRVPLYRLEGLVSFYPHFRRSPAPRAAVGRGISNSKSLAVAKERLHRESQRKCQAAALRPYGKLRHPGGIR